ncbi:MAG TPA: FAD-dependent oxidoreductase [Longimicrobiales bacterium]
MRHVVFVGLGFGGLYTLRRLVDEGSQDLEVTAVDRRDRFVFTPLLYEYLSGELDPNVMAPRLDELVPDNVRLLRDEAREVDVRARVVHLASGRTLTFDVLVLAPGSVPAFHGVEGAQAHAVPFYSLEDAERLRVLLDAGTWARSGLPACVVGGGVVGVELAFALAERLERAANTRALRPEGRPSVVILEAMDDILRGLSPRMRRMAKKKLARRGIAVRTGVRVLEVDPRGVALLDGGRRDRVDAAVVAWAAGIRVNPLIERLPAERHGNHGVRVERTLQLPGEPHVFVLGDAISYPGRVEGEPLPDTAQAAVQESEVCAANVACVAVDRLPRERFHFSQLGTFLRIARYEGIADIKGVVLDGAPAALARRAAYVVRLPAWALRTAAIRQWLGLEETEEEAARRARRRAA